MADVNVKVKIDNAEASKSLRELNKSLKELVSAQEQVAAGTPEWKKLRDAINETEGRIGDLQDSFGTLRGSGVERLTASTSLLTEGFQKFDTGKIKIGLQGIGAAMKAIPIFLLIEGVRLLIENWDDLVKGFKDFFAIESQVEKETRILNQELKKQQEITKTLGAALENQIKILEAQGASEEKIFNLKKKLNAEKLKELEADLAVRKNALAQVILNDTLLEQGEKKIAQILRASGNNIAADAIDKKIAKDKEERIKEETEKIRESVIAINNLKTQQRVDEINQEKKTAKSRQELIVKSNDDEKKLRDLRIANIQNQYEKEIALENARYQDAIEAAKGNQAIIEQLNVQHFDNLADIENKSIDEQEKIRLEKLKKEREAEAARLKEIEENNVKQQAEAITDLKARLEAETGSNDLQARKNQLEVLKQLELSNAELTEGEIANIKKKYRDLNNQLDVEANNGRLQSAQSVTAAIGGLSNLLYQIEENNTKAGTAARERAAKRQFEIAKGVEISAAVISGATGILNTLTAKTTIPQPFDLVYKIAQTASIAALTATTIAKITSTGFKSSGAASAPSLPTPTAAAPAQQSLPQQFTRETPTTRLNEDGSQTIVAKVYEGEMTEKQRRVDRYRRESTF